MRWRILVFAASSLAATSAEANGRFPAAVSVVESPDDPDTILVGATFGLLLSRNGGVTWHWVCEPALGYSSQWDPIYAVEAGSGTFAATTYRGMRVSDDGGCTWEPRGGEHEQDWISGLAVRDDGAWLLSSASGGRANGVFLTTDDAGTFEPTDLQSDTELFRKVLVSGSRAWVGGYSVSPVESAIYTSDDAGEHWSATSLFFEGTAGLVPLGVDPSNPEVFYYSLPTATSWELQRTTDGGATAQTLLTLGEPWLAFAVSLDGGTVLAGARQGGVQKSTDGGQTFEPAPVQLQAECFARAGERVYACGHNWEDGFAVGRSDDWGDSWEPIFRFVDIAGALPCPDGTPVAEECAPTFYLLCEQFGLEGPGCERPPDPDGGADDGSVDGGTKRDPGGCDCSSLPGGLDLGFALLLLHRVASRDARHRFRAVSRRV